MRSLLVAPHMGAWIETPYWALGNTPLKVAPHMGAWIETEHNQQEEKVS